MNYSSPNDSRSFLMRNQTFPLNFIYELDNERKLKGRKTKFLGTNSYLRAGVLPVLPQLADWKMSKHYFTAT